MTAAYMFAVILLAYSLGALTGEAYGRSRERKIRARMRRRLAELTYDELTLRLANADASELADNDRWSRVARHRTTSIPSRWRSTRAYPTSPAR